MIPGPLSPKQRKQLGYVANLVRKEMTYQEAAEFQKLFGAAIELAARARKTGGARANSRPSGIIPEGLENEGANNISKESTGQANDPPISGDLTVPELGLAPVAAAIPEEVAAGHNVTCIRG